MNAALFAYSRQGCKTARRVMECLEETDALEAYTMERFEEAGFSPLRKPGREFYGSIFNRVHAMIFISSVGLAVREIAPHLKSKATDPAVLVLDELGRFVIPVLSGHIGGANALAEKLAQKLGATPVITTATDINGRFSVDAWAAKNGYCLSGLSEAKAVSAAILEENVPLKSDFPVIAPLPSGLVMGETGTVGIYVGFRKQKPFEKTLTAIPRILHLGLGCRKGTPAEAVRRAVETVLEENHIEARAICSAASVDLKAQEPGLLEYCREAGLPVHFYSAKELNALRGDFTPSEFVKSVTGVDNVCERAARMEGTQLVVKKTVCCGVTVALAAEYWEVRFG